MRRYALFVFLVHALNYTLQFYATPIHLLLYSIQFKGGGVLHNNFWTFFFKEVYTLAVKFGLS